jgi:hypothetical protein
VDGLAVGPFENDAHAALDARVARVRLRGATQRLSWRRNESTRSLRERRGAPCRGQPRSAACRPRR